MTLPAQLLVVSPDEAVRDAARQFLQLNGHALHVAHGVTPARRLLSRIVVDAILLDTILPSEDTEAFWRWLCTERYHELPPPTIFLAPPSAALVPSTLPAFFDRRRHGFVTKPLDAAELAHQVTRVLAAAPSGKRGEDLLRSGCVTLDCTTKQLLFANGGSVFLTPTESRLLRYLMQQAGEFVSTDDLLSEVWGYPPGTGGPEVLRAHVSNLRRKLRMIGQDPQLVRTMPYHGYGFALDIAAGVSLSAPGQ